MGAQGHSLRFAHNRPQLCTFVAFLDPFLRGSSQNDDNRGQSWTIVDKCLKPPFAKPPFGLSRAIDRGLKFSIGPFSEHHECPVNRNTGIEIFDRD